MTSPASSPRTIRELLPYRLQRAIHYAVKPAALSYGKRFNITIGEWRIIGTLQMDGPLSLNALSDATDIQLAQASRMVARLTERGLISSRPDDNDKRRVLLSLTPEGRKLYRQMFDEARQRHEQLLAVLTPEEQKALFDTLEKIALQGRQLFEADVAKG